MSRQVTANGFLMVKRHRLYLGDCFNALKSLKSRSVDLIISSPPYCMNKAYESPEDDVDTFREVHEKIIPELYRVLKVGGSICWQTGYHVSPACIVPLDYLVYEIFTRETEDKPNPLILRNRIIWTFGHGLNANCRFSGRHETILWFSKGPVKRFNLDEIRIPQKYPGKRGYKGENKGKLTGNPLGKNPSDVWDIPNVKANHVEKTDHPCQFPVALPMRLIKALTVSNDHVLDPFMGVGSTGVAAEMCGRCFIGAELSPSYFKTAKGRIQDAIDGIARVREDVPVAAVDQNSAVAKLPEEFKKAREAKS